MQIKQYIKGIAKAAVKPLYKALSSSFPTMAPGIVMAAGGRFRWLLSGMEAYKNKIFYSGLNILVQKLVEVPILFSEKKPDATKVKFDKFYSNNITNEKRFALKELALKELGEDHSINKLFDNPNTYSSRIELMEDFWYNYGFGDGFLWFEPIDSGRDKGKPIRIHSLNRSRVEIEPSTDKLDPVGKYWYTCWNGTRIPIEKENILHLKHWNPNIADLRGMGINEPSSMDVSLNNENNKAQGAAFKNGGRGTLFSSDITVDKDGNVTEKATADQMEVLQDTIESDFAGAANNRRMYFSNAHINAQNYGDTLAEMDLVKTEDSHWKNTYTVIGVPWALSPAASSVSENSVVIAFKSFVTNKIVPELRKFDQKLQGKLRQWWPGVIVCHDLTEFTELAPDLKLMKEVYGAPSLTENERRAIYGYDELPGDIGNAVLVAAGLMKLEDIVNNEFDAVPNPADEEQTQL